MTHPTRTPTHWRLRAACRGTNPDLFFPEPSAPRSQTAAAKAVCARCPVRDACLDEALTRIPDGILGGLTAEERRRHARRRGFVVRPITAFDLPGGARTRAEAANAGRALICGGPLRRIRRADLRCQRADGLPVARFPNERRAGGVVSIPEPTPRDLAVWALRTAIREIARDVHGATIVQVAIAGMPSIKRDALDDPLAGVGAALLARDVANAELRTYAEQARGAGRSWDDVGEALGLAAAAGDAPRDERAYRLVVEGAVPPPQEPTWSRRPVARWTCASCGQRVTDHGPFAANPDDNETGHSTTCPRRARDIAAYNADRDEY